MSSEHTKTGKQESSFSGPSQGTDGSSEAKPKEIGGVFPTIDFPTFLVSMYHSALVHLGEVVEEGQPRGVNLPMAKQSIDILGMLGEKTKGNLTAEEERLLQAMLYELRMKYIQKSP